MATCKKSLQVDERVINRCADALVRQYREYWPGSWPASTEANGLAMAVVKEYLTTAPIQKTSNWECPVGKDDCTENCGSYGCGN